MVEFLLVAFVIGECIVFIYLWKFAIKYLKSGNYHSIKTVDNKSNTKANKPTNQTKSSWLFSEHNDPDEENKKELIKNGVYDETSFEEEELEEDDYHYEDD